MTGLDPFKHGVIEVGMIVMDEKFEIIGEFFMDLCPPHSVTIDPEALEYNGFSLDRIALWKSYEEFCIFFETFYGTYFDDSNKPIIVGQYVTADICFLSSIFFHARKSYLAQKLWNDIIDTKSIANVRNAVARYHGKDIPHKSTSLSKPGGLAEYLNISDYSAHTARGDVLATREVLIKLLKLEGWCINE